ncbi:MAG TPA: PHB depolymerase family esterase [Actinophytocola sp.]|jgi:polyhydroxybutyrate depolymerase|nr:PHB depolymerase family esterase [Actinophytocola sp.]
MRGSPVVLCVLVLLGGLFGCVRGTPDGTSERTVSVGGVERAYRLYRPAGLADPAPLVVMLHGGFGSGKQAEGAYGWDAEADAGHFAVAYPDGVSRAWNTGGGCCGQPGHDGVDDIGFLTELVADVGREVPVDPARVFATGISNGGIMAYTLACATTVFAAIGPDSATQLGGCDHPAPVSVIHIHGTADQNIPYDGRPGNGVATIDGPPVPEVNARWRSIDRCAAPDVTAASPVTTSIADCPDGRTVELVTIDGAGHQWPGATGRKLDGRVTGIDPPSTALDATHEIWKFFAAHPAAH